MILDEADLLLSGGFERDVQRILEGMKQSDRERQAQQVSKQLGISLDAFQALPRHLKAAAYEGQTHMYNLACSGATDSGRRDWIGGFDGIQGPECCRSSA